jgi:hypothetical protein
MLIGRFAGGVAAPLFKLSRKILGAPRGVTPIIM